MRAPSLDISAVPTEAASRATQLRELEKALSSAVVASLPLPAADRLTFVGKHLLAQLKDGEAPPASTEAPRSSTTPELRAELDELQLKIAEAINDTRGKPGWPIQAVADVLVGDTTVVPPQVQAVFDAIDKNNDGTLSLSEVGCSTTRSPRLGCALTRLLFLSGCRCGQG